MTRSIGLIIVGLSLVLGGLVLRHTSCFAKHQGPRIEGTVIQYQTWMMKLSKEQWLKELEAMRALGLKVIVLQWLKYDQEHFFPAKVDSTRVILEYADLHDIEVYLGLNFDRVWWEKWDDSEFLKKTALSASVFSTKIWTRYKKYRSFAGWYIPYELGDYDLEEDKINRLNNFYRAVTRKCKKLSKKRKLPVALSVFFSGKKPPKYVYKIYGELLKGTQIDILMVQDGVGVRNWFGEVEEKVLPYLEAFRGAARKNGAETWAVLENFTLSQGSNGEQKRIPTDISDLSDQIELQAPKADKLLMFDFFHYMSPQRGKLQGDLYKDYQIKIRGQTP